MEYFVEQAPTHREAEERVLRKYGESARIMHHRTVRTGGFLGFFTRENVEVTGYLSSEPRRTRSGAQARTLEDEKKKLLDLARPADRTLDDVLSEIRSLKETLQSPQTMPNDAGAEDAHPVISEVRGLLETNDFTPGYTRRIVARMRREFSVEQLDDREYVHEQVMQWIAESIRIHEPRSSGRPEILILVGPTGVGKTTTIAKLAATYGLDRSGARHRDIRVLTIDNYRIGARQQIETYGQIMDIPVSFVESPEEMRKYLALYQGADMVFVDTIGKSPRDFRKLGEMNELLSICGSRARVHLAISATTKSADVAEIATQFEPFKYEAVIVTKLDETTRTGNIISVLAEREKPISFLTDGQRVPQDIARATVVRLLMNIEGFSVSRAQLEKRFQNA